MSWCDLRHMKTWTEAEIQEWYDKHPDIVLSDYAKQLAININRLKQILQS
jgi:hypothetical protein